MRVSVKDAAKLLDVSEITVRRKLRTGELAGEQEPRPQGFRWVVLLPDSTATPDHTSSAEQLTTDRELLTTDQPLVEELRSQVGFLRDELTQRGEELQRVHTLMAQQGQTIQALTQQVEQLPATIEARARAETLHSYANQAVQPLLHWGIPYLLAAGVGGVVWQFARGVDWESLGDMVTLSFSILGLIVGTVLVVVSGRETRAALARGGSRAYPNATPEQLVALDRSIRLMVWVTLTVITVLFLIPLLF